MLTSANSEPAGIDAQPGASAVAQDGEGADTDQQHQREGPGDARLQDQPERDDLQAHAQHQPRDLQQADHLHHVMPVVEREPEGILAGAHFAQHRMHEGIPIQRHQDGEAPVGRNEGDGAAQSARGAAAPVSLSFRTTFLSPLPRFQFQRDVRREHIAPAMHGADRQRHVMGGCLAPQPADHHVDEAAPRDGAVGVLGAVRVERIAADLAVRRVHQPGQEIALSRGQAEAVASRADQRPALVDQPPGFLLRLVGRAVGHLVGHVQAHRAPHQRLQHGRQLQPGDIGRQAGIGATEQGADAVLFIAERRDGDDAQAAIDGAQPHRGIVDRS
ncbi:hypothetical protein BBAD15_g12500 [Beauveria bassiana D1-5]|uniref:Uncharacterized protein n=1 Tax=Beauveria bassiana D1-5 TaxID=1245745 RepID=A0A0A2V3E4_BEABA|nr:hypothetical protein BBAD15_g12500 [Beauveria bassiana D1-5]